MKPATRQSKYPVPDGPGMNNLKGPKNRFLRKTYWNLPIEKQAELKVLAERHFNACKKYGKRFDDKFFVETIPDMRDNRFQ